MGISAVERILERSPDVVFLDIQMPGMDGFEVLRALPGESLPAVIFLTAYEQHVLRAFDVHALHYLLKPVDDITLRGSGQSSSRSGRFRIKGRHGTAGDENAGPRLGWIRVPVYGANWIPHSNRHCGGY